MCAMSCRALAPSCNGLSGAGTMVVGSFTRPDDGQTYLVADWRDIDDASFTFYYRPETAAPVLAISQFNN